MTATFECMNVYDLAEFSFIAGDRQVLSFNVYTSGSVAVDVTSATITWRMAFYGQTTSALTKSGSATGSPTNNFTVTLDSADTIALSGKFIHQPTVVDLSGNTFKSSQGIIFIKPAIT